MTEQLGEVKTFGNPPIPVVDVVDDEGNTYCQLHPDRPTGLRCNNCGRLMCAKCAVHTPVGYRCEQCVQLRESRFFNADISYYVKLVAVCLVLSAIGAFVANFVGWFLFVIFVAMAAGGVISEAAARVTRGQRGRYGPEAAAAGVLAGVLVMVLISAGLLLSRYSGAGAVPPEVLQQLTEQYGAEAAQEIIAEYTRQTAVGFGDVVSLAGRILLDLSVILYAAIAVVTVYGRLNIFGRRKRR